MIHVKQMTGALGKNGFAKRDIRNLRASFCVVCMAAHLAQTEFEFLFLFVFSLCLLSMADASHSVR